MKPAPADIETDTLRYLNRVMPPGTRISRQTALLSSGLLDSLQVLDWVEYLEKKWNVSLQDETLTPDQFETAAAAAAFVATKLK